MLQGLKKIILDGSRYIKALPLLSLKLPAGIISNINNGTLAVIKPDEIGDYILFRNFLKQIKNSEKFGNLRITLIGNIVWKSIAEHYDSDYVDEFIWLDKEQFRKSDVYRKKLLTEINKRSFEYVVNPLMSRNFLTDDLIVRSMNAKERIAAATDSSNSPALLNKISDKYYTELVTIPKDLHFEFYKIKYFFETLLDADLNIQRPSIEVIADSKFRNNQKPYAVIFPGASREYKRWPADRFVELSKFISDKYDFDIMITGGPSETEIAEGMKTKLKNIKIINKAGKTTLTELISLISQADILISNDTVAAHISALTGRNTVMLTDGSRFGRFSPYPQDLFPKVISVYPPGIRSLNDNFALYAKKFKYRSPLKVKDITLESVIVSVNKLINKF